MKSVEQVLFFKDSYLYVSLIVRKAILFVLIGTIIPFPVISCAAQSKSINSASQACSILKKGAVKYRLSRHDLSGRYYCDHIGDNKTYYLVGLRYRVSNNEAVGSNLLGWFAIRRTDGQILEWDINESKAIPLVPGPPFEK